MPTVAAAQVQHLFAQTPAGVIANACAAVAVAAVLWPQVPGPWLAVWCLIQVVLCGVTLGLVRRYRHGAYADPDSAVRGLMARFVPNGAMWGLTYLFLPAATPSQQLLLLIVIVGVCAGSVPTFASVLTLYLVYISTILAPGAVWFSLHPASPSAVLGPLTVVFAVMLAYTARNYSSTLQRSYRLAAEKASLVGELQRAKARVDAANQQLQYDAAHDSLTGLINRREFARRLQRLMASGGSGQRRCALCYLDLDQFKIVNDTCGHSAGDTMLKQLTAVFGRVLAGRGVLARLGGDEFGVLLEHCSELEAEQCAWALRDEVEAYRFNWAERTFKVGVSVGVFHFTPHGEIADGALRAADAACLAAKEAGGHRVHVYHPGDRTMLRRSDEMRWVARIGEALDEDRLELYAQPIQPLTRRHIGPCKRFELLLRLRAREGEVVGPQAFLSAAERYGLSIDIDRWVVDRLLRWAARHPEHVRNIELCSINLSGVSLGDHVFLEQLEHRIGDMCFEPSQLCFEITETAAIGNMHNAIAFMQRLRRLGCAFALDDFGSGLSSLAYLKSLPLDYLKIDGLFIKGLLDNRVDHAMVSAICEIGGTLGLRTVAEFVESEQVLTTLESIGVHYAQGYHIGKPVPLDELFSGTTVSEVYRATAGARRD